MRDAASGRRARPSISSPTPAARPASWFQAEEDAAGRNRSRRIGAVLYHDGEAEDPGLFPLVFGRPERALVWLAGALAQRGRAIEAGDTVLSRLGDQTYPVARGDRFEFDFGAPGKIALSFE